MKTKSSPLFKGLIALMLAFIFASCGSADPNPESVAAKINDNSELTQADYATMIDYCGNYAKDAQKYYYLINAQPNDSTREAVTATNDLASLYGSHVYLDQFRGVLSSIDMSALDKENTKKVNEYAKYQGFPLPGGEAADLENPQVVGDIEQTPSSDTTAVISQGDGEAVNVNVAN